MKRGAFTKRSLSAALAAFLAVLFLTLPVFAAYPTPSNNVYDGTETLSDAVIQNIKQSNDSLFDKVGARISFCLVNSLDGETIEDYARGVFSDWKLGEGVLLVIYLNADNAAESNYYAIQSVGIDKVLTNDELSSILQEFLEPDFIAGSVSTGIQKTNNKLASFLKTELAAANAETGETDGESKTDSSEEKKVTFGGVILSILKIILWTAIILVVAFVAFFIVALYNDTAAELMQRYIFNRGRTSQNRQNAYYDERLYGNQRNGQQRKAPSQQSGIRNQGNRPANGPRSANGTRPNGYQNGYQNGPNRPRPNASQRGTTQQTRERQQSVQQNAQQNRYRDNYEYTQQYHINGGPRINRS